MLLRWAGSRRTSQCLSRDDLGNAPAVRRLCQSRRCARPEKPDSANGLKGWYLEVLCSTARRRLTRRLVHHERLATTEAACGSCARNTPLSRRVPPPTRNTAEGLPSRRWTKAWKLGRFTVLASAIEDRRTHRRSAKAHGVAALRDISAADDLGPRTTNVSFLTASALSTSARGTGTLPTTACDGCSPGLPLTTNPPLGRWCDSSGDPAGSGHGTEPSASWRRNRQQPSGAQTEGSVLPCGGLRRPCIRVRLTPGHPVSLSLPLRRARRPGMGEHP